LYDNRFELGFNEEITGIKYRTDAYFPLSFNGVSYVIEKFSKSTMFHLRFIPVVIYGKFSSKIWVLNCTRYNLDPMVFTHGMSELTEEILGLISEEGEIRIKEIKEKLNITTATLATEIFFLTELGFVQLDKSKEYIRLTKRSKKFFEEHPERDIGSVFLLC